MELHIVLLLLLLGGFVGFMAGLLGIGGGMLIVPFLSMIFGLMGVDPTHIVHLALATSLATILLTSASSIRAHHRHGAIRWDIALMFVPGILIGSWFGPALAARLDARVMAGFFALFVGYSATRILRDRKPRPEGALPGRAGMVGAGGLIGGLAGMLGAGGAFMAIPFMVRRNVPIHSAVGTGAVLGFPIAVAGTLSYIYSGWHVDGLPPGSLGYLYPPAFFAIAASSVFTAPLGARVAHATNTRVLKRVFACMLFMLAAYMGWKAVA